MESIKKDIVIIGAGMVGISLAYQIKEKYKNLSILILEKEKEIGMHNSGRNSGVLHAGIYYEPNSLRARVCVDGAQRLKEWIKSQGLEILNCGKLIVAQKEEQSSNLEFLFERGKKNGAEVEMIDKKELYKRAPYAFSATGTAIWSPKTSVVNPKKILLRMQEILHYKKVNLLYKAKIIKAIPEESSLIIKSGNSKKKIVYEHLFNCAGVFADSVAKEFNIGKNYKILPFKGIYWKLKSNTSFNIKMNIYPVPDLNVPFLGVHVTPNLKGEINFGPTAIPAFGRENYSSLNGFEPLLTSQLIGELTNQWLKNSNGFRKYAKEQAFLGFKKLFLKSAQEIIPDLKNEHLIKSDKVGIRAQLFDKNKSEFVNDFLLENSFNSTHVLNAISPAFTASFALADLIIEKSQI